MSEKRSRFRRTACALLAAVLLVGTAVPTASADYKSEWQKAEQELKKEKDKYNQIKKNGKKAEEQKKNLQNQQSIIKGQITDILTQIDQKNCEIGEKQQGIADQQASIDTRWQNFQDQMLAMQIMHDSGAVAMLASADSLYDLLNFSSALQQISQKNTDVLEEMTQQRQQLENDKQVLEQAKTELEEARNALTEKQGQLAANIQQQDANISMAQAEAQAQAEVVSEAQKKADAAEAQYEAWVRANASSGSGQSAEGFIWPLPGRGRITTEFGATQIINGVVQRGHGGLDIAMPAGTPIYASHNGVIASTTGHSSYGNVVMVDNGDGITTLYAHMLSCAVSVGQQVVQGQVIGYVGSTGNSTGNHLHFEVRVNGVRQNPRNFVTQP